MEKRTTEDSADNLITDEVPASFPQDSVLGVPSAYELRSEIEEKVLRDLLGPAGGDHEEVDEDHISDRYLVGMLAAKRQSKAIEPEEQDELALAGADDSEDGSDDAKSLEPISKLMLAA